MSDEKREKNLGDVVRCLHEIRQEIEATNKTVNKIKYFDDLYNKSVFQNHIEDTYLNPVLDEMKKLENTVFWYGFLILGVLVYIAYFVSKSHL